jgi:hypothetical protein
MNEFATSITADTEFDVSRPMDEIVKGLWVGDLSAVTATHLLEKNNIKSIISVMRGRVKVGDPVGSTLPYSSNRPHG